MRGKGATQAAIDEMPVSKFREGMYDEDDATCIICLTPYGEGDELRVLPCGGKHHFHKDCLDSWLRINATCPSCREVVVPEGSGRATVAEQEQTLAGVRRGGGGGESSDEAARAVSEAARGVMEDRV